MDVRVCVLKGGISAERDISLKSGENVEEALKKAGYFVFSIDFKNSESLFSLGEKKADVVFIALHGPGGEDGTVQGWFELIGVAYTGSGVLASALGMDKSFCRKIWKLENLKQPEYQIVKSFPFSLKLSLPLIVKPARSGSTLGVSLVKERAELEYAIKQAFKYDREYVIVEEYIQGREITVGVIDDPEPRALPVIEIIPRGELYDYHTKYTQGMCEYVVPANFSEADYIKIQNTALKAYNSLGCRDFARVDMIWREGEVYMLEVNTIPGLTAGSLLPRAAKAEGIEFPQLMDKIVKQALKRKDESF
ncbi:D-alanine--D-alanine ligase [Candidatus Aerophobetes bacterium]|nr:D-alanine--D-alanine ligase [Candidatus Aerophobetes bacterium]